MEHNIKRKILQIELENAFLFGTMHFPEDHDDMNDKPGLLLLSFGQQPRSWVGDLGVNIADRVAKSGIIVFRVDMPGLGDSPGELPIHLEVLWREIQLGSHEKFLCELCRKLQDEYPIDGLVVGGFCGGAVTAVYAVNTNLKQLKGFVLIEPEFSLTRIDAEFSGKDGRKQLTIRSYLSRRQLFFRNLLSKNSWKKFLSGKSDFKFWGNFFNNVLYNFFRGIFRSKSLPPEANMKYIEAWKKARRKSIPTLVLSDGSSVRNKYYKKYGLSPGKNNSKKKLKWIEIPNTTHAMLAGGAKESVCKYIEEWFQEKKYRN